MFAEARFHDLSRQVCDLVECETVHLLLGCPEPELRHPLLNYYSSDSHHYIGCYSSAGQSNLLENEHIRALCDIALQTGHLSLTNQAQLLIDDVSIQSIALAPLERPAGLLGLFVLVDSSPNTFQDGEHLLLSHYLPTLAQSLENVLLAMYDVDTVSHSKNTSLLNSGRGIELVEPALSAIELNNITIQLEQRVAECLQELSQVHRQLEDRSRQIAVEKVRTEAILTGITDGVIITDVREEDGHQFMVVGWNAAATQLTHVEAGVATGRELSQILPWRDQAGRTLSDLAMQVLFSAPTGIEDEANQAEYHIPTYIHWDTSTPDRSERIQMALEEVLRQKQEKPAGQWLSVSAAKIHLAESDAVGSQIVFVLRDISRQKELDRLKNEFISMVSHELRSPLTAIKGYAGLLQAYGIQQPVDATSTEVEMTPARQQEYLNTILEQANHLEVLISDLLDISRIHEGRLALRCTQVNIALLSQRIVQLMQLRADQVQPERYTIRCVLAPDLPLSWADPDRVQQILTNLLENAIKYSPDGGLIEVLGYVRRSFTPYKGLYPRLVDPHNETPGLISPLMMHITVRDQGIGISHKQRADLFKPFSRLKHAKVNQIPGAGLGLYITRKLVDAMGGDITLSSREGEGTSVTFTLPLYPPEGLDALDKRSGTTPISEGWSTTADMTT